MPTTQDRAPLGEALAFHSHRPASSLVARQFTAVLTATATFADGTDSARIDATAGAVNATLPAGSDSIIGLEYFARKVDSSGNAAGLACAGTDTFADLTTSLTTTTEGAEVGATWDGTFWRPLAAAGAGGPVSATTLAASTAVTVGGTGTGTAAGKVTINKTAAGNADFEAKAAGVLRARVRLDGTENLIISLHDAAEAEVGSITIAVTTGLITLSKGTTITAGGLVIAAGNLTLTLGTILLSAGLVSAADDAAAAVASVPVGGLYRTASAVKIRVA